MEWIEKNAAPDTDVVIYAGDFNTESGDLPHRYSAVLQIKYRGNVHVALKNELKPHWTS